MKKNRENLILVLAIVALIGSLIFWYFDQSMTKVLNKEAAEDKNSKIVEVKVSEKKDRVKKIEIKEGSTYGNLMATSGVLYELATEIYEVAEEIYDLVKIRQGRVIELIYDKYTDEFKELRYKVDTEDELIVVRIASGTEDFWQAELVAIPYEIKTKIAQGAVESSMYQAAMDNEIDIRAIIELANAFQWEIDFAMDPRVGDTFKFIYEERYLDNEYVMPGEIFAGYYINDGVKHEIYYFEEDEKNKGFFDKDGNSVQKMFLKAPVAFKYISSHFTTGPRYVGGQYQVFTSSHMAIDYAAAVGTPVRSVGNGTVTYVGWNGNYGRFISVHHNGTYSTNYAHLSRYAVSRGQKVSQSQVIGYVGSSGFSTGPHLHYEMVKNGAKVNPLREVLPPGKPIKNENKDRFFKEIKKWQEMLN